MYKIKHGIVISRTNLLAELFDRRWSKEFLVDLSHCTPDDSKDKLAQIQVHLVIFDLATVDFQYAYLLQSQLAKERPEVLVAFINFPRTKNLHYLVQLHNAAGIFYLDNGIKELDRGLKLILSGHRVIPADLSGFSKDAAIKIKVSYKLTSREREVLKILLTGSTNQDIAGQLYVSESTIKTHLYRAYRKIGVSSRGQAIAWAQTNLYQLHA